MAILFMLALAMGMYDKKQFERERQAWVQERKDLLSRIQARDLNEYTANVVREKKAEQPKDEMNYDEFVS
jgi:hypothetical protein